MAELKDPIAEAKRYLSNAKTILKEKAELKEKSYSDKKYVQMAGDTAWKGCLIALDCVFNVAITKGDARVSIKNYKEAVAKRDRKLSAWVADAYNVLHLSMGYDGTKRKAIADEGLDLAKSIIDRCETLRV